MKIEIRNLQSIKQPCCREIRRLFRFLLQCAQTVAPEPCWGTISLVLTDNDQIRRLNGLYFNRHQPTDVISFRYHPLPDEVNLADGEIIINVERAIEVGPRWGGVNRELALYLAHGCDHLTGAGDASDTERYCMRRRELRWLRRAREQGWAGKLI
jgi:probable rRNA maturation factor